MKFFMKVKPEFIGHLQTGTQLKLTMGERLVDVTIAEVEDEKVYLEATGEDEKYLQSLFKEKISTLSISGR